LSGFSGCNTYATSYTASDGLLTVNPPAATMMACPSGMAEEAAYLETLSKAENYTVVGTRLTINADQGSSVLVYTSANLPLEKTLWSLVDFAGNPTPEGTEITAVFLPEGAETPATVGGSAGCNTYSAGYTLDGQNIAIDPAVTTRMYCEGAMEAETAYLAALQAAQTYQIMADTLTVETTSGTLTYAADRTPLTGALWVLTGMGDPQNLQAPVEGAYFTAQFTRNPGSPSGVVAGSTGCNEYAAAYTANLQEIKINLPNKSDNPCSDAIVEQEQGYFLALNDARSYTILGSTLYIPYDNGRQELVYTATQVQSQPSRPLSDLDGSYWFLHTLGNQPTLPGTTVTASFAINADGASGSMSGSAGCNSYAANFGDNLGVTTSLTSGERCSEPAGVMEQESAYLEALSRAYGYWLTGDQLILNSSLGALTYRQTAPVTSMDQSYLLQGVTWYLVSINTTPVVAGSGVANVYFDANSTLNGFTGCNSMSGSYTTDIDKISISQLSSTKAACPDSASSAQETAFLNGLSSAQTYQVAGSAMQIIAQSGVLNFSTQQPDVPPTPIPATAVISGPTQGMVGQALTFDASASSSASPIVRYSWDFGDGGKASGEVVQHVYTQPGTFTVTMTVQNQTGFQDTATLVVAIQAQPQPDQPPQAAVEGPAQAFVAETVSFSAAASQPGTNPIASYAWNFGNGVTSQPSADPNASAIYDQPGVYQVTVVVMDTKGLSSSATLEISIDSRPQTGEWILSNTLPGTSITLTFRQGQFSGFTGCNSYSGSYTASDNGDGTYSVSASGLVATGAICSEEVMAQESAYLEALQTVSLASIQGNAMQLSYANGTLVYYLSGTPQPR
jgi:heat shock protein HslJ